MEAFCALELILNLQTKGEDMAFHNPFSFGGVPSRSASGNTSSMSNQHLYNLDNARSSQTCYVPAPIMDSSARGFPDMDLNESQLEVVYDSQVMPNMYLSQEENTGNKRSRKTTSECAGDQAKNTGGRFHWDSRSTVILIEVKRTHDEGRFHAGIWGKAKTLEEQWVDMVNAMARRGLFVDWKVASDKWKRMFEIHKEIADWERNTPSGKNSYWQMTPRERKEEGKFSHLNFERDVFDVMEQNFVRDPVINPPASVVDTTNLTKDKQPMRETGSPMSAGVAASEVGDQTDYNFEQTHKNSGVQKKTRKRMQVYDVGLKEAMKDIAQALGAAEESRDHRHKEALECNKELVRIEGLKVEMGMQFTAGIRGLSDSLKDIAESLRRP